MQLKIILLPTLVVLSLVLGIGFIKPDYDALTQKRVLLAEKQTQVDKIESVKSNVSTLSGALDSKSDLEQWSLRYYPETMDQERIIDGFNFMAQQSGLIIKAMDMKEIIVEKKEAFDVGGPLTSIPGQEAEGMATITPAYIAPVPSSYVAQVQAKGSYENLKNFMDRLSRMDRMNSLRLVSIGVDKDSKEVTDTGQAAATTEQLVGTFEARFDHIKSPKQQSALGIPVFEQGTLDTTGLEAARTWATSPVPLLDVGQAGRSNPFQ